MPQKKQTKKIKVRHRDLKPRKDAKGGGLAQQRSAQDATHHRETGVTRQR